MLFKVGNEIIDTGTTPVALIFKNKDEAKVLADIISQIKNGDTEYPVDDNGNWWIMPPFTTSKEEIDKWSTLTDQQKELLRSKPCIGRPVNEL